MATRLKDIAESLGVSIVTVSKALRNHPDIAKDTRERVLHKVKELNYRPNLMARSLVTGRSSLIGLVVPDLVHPFFSEIAKALSGALRKRNYFLLVASSESDPALEQAEIEHMLAHRLDALVVASMQSTSEGLLPLVSGGPAVVLLDRNFISSPFSFVGADDYKIGTIATEHLIGLKRKRIAHIRGPENNVGLRRFEGYRDSLLRHKLKFREELIIETTVGYDTNGVIRGQAAAEALLTTTPRPDAVFCFNDLIAVGVMMRLLEAGLRVPEDVAVIGCGNYHYDALLKVPLSSVDQQVDELGKRLAKLIFSLLDAETPPKRKIVVLEPKLVARQSTLGSSGKPSSRP